MGRCHLDIDSVNIPHKILALQNPGSGRKKVISKKTSRSPLICQLNFISHQCHTHPLRHLLLRKGARGTPSSPFSISRPRLVSCQLPGPFLRAGPISRPASILYTSLRPRCYRSVRWRRPLSESKAPRKLVLGSIRLLSCQRRGGHFLRCVIIVSPNTIFFAVIGAYADVFNTAHTFFLRRRCPSHPPCRPSVRIGHRAPPSSAASLFRIST